MHTRMVTLLSFPVNKVCQLRLGFQMAELRYKNASASTKYAVLNPQSELTLRQRYIAAAIGTRHQSSRSFSLFLVREYILSMMSVPIL
jgi:hypothetical protein